MPTPKNAPYKKKQRKRSFATLFDGRTRSRAHPHRRYTIDEAGTIWRKDKYDARFGRRP